jgi:hypothetical protein
MAQGGQIIGQIGGKLRSMLAAGTASAIGGGKFSNGVVSNSFSYLKKIGNYLKNIMQVQMMLLKNYAAI